MFFHCRQGPILLQREVHSRTNESFPCFPPPERQTSRKTPHLWVECPLLCFRVSPPQWVYGFRYVSNSSFVSPNFKSKRTEVSGSRIGNKVSQTLTTRSVSLLDDSSRRRPAEGLGRDHRTRRKGRTVVVLTRPGPSAFRPHTGFPRARPHRVDRGWSTTGCTGGPVNEQTLCLGIATQLG